MPDYPLRPGWPASFRREAERRRLRIRREVPESLHHLTGFSIMACAHAAGRRFEFVLAPLGLTVKEFVVLAVVQQRPGIPTISVGERMGLSRQRSSELVTGLVASEVIARYYLGRNRRTKRLRLTAEGTALYEKALAAVTATDAEWQEGLDVEERGALRTALLRLAPNHSAIRGKYWRVPD